MGWWSTNTKGESFTANNGVKMLWGDGPADLMDDAVARIIREFQSNFDRKPTHDEMVAGLLFSIRIPIDGA